MSTEEKEALRDIFSRKTMYGDLICTTEVVLADAKVFGDNTARKLEFDVWDGFAYCYDYLGKEYKMEYPKKSLINMATEMAKTIREHLSLDEKERIEPVHILMTYNQLSEAY